MNPTFYRRSERVTNCQLSYVRNECPDGRCETRIVGTLTREHGANYPSFVQLLGSDNAAEMPFSGTVAALSRVGKDFEGAHAGLLRAKVGNFDYEGKTYKVLEALCAVNVTVK